jgi:hypothetical protein
MLKFKNPWTPGLLMLGALLVVGVGARLAFPPRPPGPAAATPGAPSTTPVAAPACASTAGCPADNRCVAPGICSRSCKTDADCPDGRRCAELRLMNPEADNAGDAVTVTTCVATGSG